MTGTALAHVPAGEESDVAVREAAVRAQPYDNLLSARNYAGLALDGTTDDAAKLSAFLAAFGTSARARLVVEGPMRLSATITLPKNLELDYLPGAMLVPDAGIVVTHLSGYRDGLTQKFDCSQGGYVTFSAAGDFTGPGYVGRVRPEHWGARGDGVTLDTVPMQHWANAIMGYPFAEAGLPDLSTPRWADCVGVLRGSANYRVQATGRRPPIQFVATHGVRIVGEGGGAGGTQSAGSTITGVGGGQFTCTDSSTTSVLVLQGTPNLIPHAWAGGLVYVVSGTNTPAASNSLWTALRIQDNDAGSITLQSAQPLAFDHTSVVILACDAILDFNGVWGGLSDITLVGDTSSGFYASLFRYWRDATFSSLGSSTGRFDRLTAEGRWLSAGLLFGGGLWQSDFNQEDNTYSPALSARATNAWNPAAPWQQTGVYFGQGQFSNNLNHAVDNIDALNVRYGAYVEKTNVSIRYGELSNCDVSCVIGSGTQGTFVLDEVRCENTRKLFDSLALALAQVPQTYRIGLIEFAANNLASDPFTGTADVIAIGAFTEVTIGAIRIHAIHGITGLTATAGSDASLTFAGTPFATKNPNGWRLRAMSGPGAGQTAVVTSSTADTLAFPAVGTPFAAGTVVEVLPIPRIRFGAGPFSAKIGGLSVQNAKFEECFILASGNQADIHEFVSTDDSDSLQVSQYVRRALITSSTSPGQTQATVDYGTDAGLDARHGRFGAGVLGFSQLSALNLRAWGVGKTPQPFVENTAGTGGGLTFAYALVGKIPDPLNPGSWLAALASDPLTVTTNGNALSWTGEGSISGAMRLHTNLTAAAPFTHYDVLKDIGDGNGLRLLEANVPAYRLDPKGLGGYYDWGLLPTSTYAPPTADQTGQFAHGGGKLGFFGTAPIAQPTVSGSRASGAAFASLLSQLAALGLIVDGSSA